MKCILPIFLLAVLQLLSCKHDGHRRKNSHTYHKKSKSASAEKDTLLIDFRTAVSVSLDSEAIEKNKKKYGDTAIEAYTEDGAYYDYLADSVLGQKKLPIIQALRYKYLKFVQKNGRITVVRVDTLPQVTTLYFFDPKKTPYTPDVTMIEDEYQKYYR
jgi:hypothetical protein